MAIIVPYEGRSRKLTRWQEEAMVVCLYKNDYTPVAGSVRASFTRATFTGYADVTASFSAPATVDPYEEMHTGILTFTLTGGAAQTIYGYFVVKNSDDYVEMAERFGTPVLLSTPGDTIKLQITFYDGQLP